jgi:hypothetical protein
MNSKGDNKKFYPKVLRGAGGGKSCTPAQPPDPHSPVEATEGIFKSQAGADKVLSRTETEATDLICEGPIQGLVSGRYTYIGGVNQIGWSNYVFNPYASKDNKPYLRSIFWKNVPLIDDVGNYNFSQINFRYDNGNQTTATSLSTTLQNASSAASIPQASRTLTVGDTLRYGTDFIKRYDFKNTNVSSLIVSLKISALFDQQNDPNRDRITYDLGCGQVAKISQTAGDIRDRTINYRFKIFKITSTGYVEIPSLQRDEKTEGKISSGIIDTFTFNLEGKYDPNDATFLGWRIQIERTSKESTVLNLKDSVTIDAITEVFRENYIYPKSAIFKSLFTSEYFQNVPDRSYDVQLLKVKIPSNYDPIKKSYNGDWDGTFKANLEWTDNPAWCYYDLLTNKRYGLGKYIKNTQVDKWSLYQIAQYCDTIVSDGFGGKEPRFTCNVIINDFSDAYNLLNDMASIFRGMSYYANGSIFPIADAPKDPYILFTNSNVENGDFNYSSSSQKTRNTVAVVRYNDMNNFAKPVVEHIEDPDGVRKYGIRKLEITAFGCTSRGQAYRLGKWALASEQLETETIDFVAGLDSLYLRPGDVIRIQDSNRIMYRLGGRVLAITTGVGGKHQFVVDEEYNKIYDYLSTNFSMGSVFNFEISTPTSRTTGTNYADFITGYQRSPSQSGSFLLNSSFITEATGYDPEKTLTKINCNKIFNTIDYNLYTGATWAIQSNDIGFGLNTETELYRVIGISEIEPFKYNINAMEYNPSKYLYVESGFSFIDSPVLEPASRKEASYPSALSLSKKDDLYLKYEIGGAVDTNNYETNFWKVYMKSGSDFTSNDVQTQYATPNQTVDVPKEDFFLNSILVPDNNSVVTGEFVPTVNNQTYFFRVYGINPIGYYSRNFRDGNFYFSSKLLGDYTNLVELNNFQYKSTYDDLTTIPVIGEKAGQFQSVALNTRNLIHDNNLNLQWSLRNIAPILKTWTNDQLIYRLKFGTGNFDGSGSISETFISEAYYSPSASSSETSAFTGFNNLDLRSYLKDDVISGFWMTIDAKEKNGVVEKYTSQQTLAGDPFNQPQGYLFGLFQNDQMTSEKYSTINTTAFINSDNNISITLGNPKPYFGSLYVFFTDQKAATGNLTQSNLNKIMYEQFDSSKQYKSFIKSLGSSGIQLREAFFNGADTFTTSASFVKTIGGAGILKSGYITIRPSTKFEDNLMAQYDKDFSIGDAYDLSVYRKNSNNSSVDAIPVNYRALPPGITTTYRFPRVNNIGAQVDTDRQIVNNLVFLPQANIDPITVSTILTNIVDTEDLNNFGDDLTSKLSGYFQGKVDNLQTQINNLDNTYATDASVDTKISNLSGVSVLTFGNQTINGLKTFTSAIDIYSGINPQSLRVFNTTGTNSGEFGLIGWTNNQFVIGSQQSQSGISRDVVITGNNININGSGNLNIFDNTNISGILNLSGNAILGRDYNNTIAVTGKFLRSIRTYNAPNASSQTTATIISSDKVIVTGAIANGSLILPLGLNGAEIEVRNRSAQIVLIYPTGNDRVSEINGGLSAINTPISIANSGNRNFVFAFSGSSGIWFT